MLMQRALLLLGLCLVVPAHAGILEDDKARQQIKALEARLQKLEDAAKQQTKSMLDLQSQIDAMNANIRNLRGLNEETVHGLQDATKRQKDFYVDLDTRVRHFEVAEQAAKAAAQAAAKNPPPVVEASGPVNEDRAFDSAFELFRTGKPADAVKAFQDFLAKYPDSIHVPYANYWLSHAQYAANDYRGALDTSEALLKTYPDTPKTSDLLLLVAQSELKLNRRTAARKTLKHIIAKFPSSEAAPKAKKLLASKK